MVADIDGERRPLFERNVLEPRRLNIRFAKAKATERPM
jgi:hypothetical protein